ncbi:MAG TPA: lysophospholipid acyltransferase family protein [Thermodesulfobacteriota bacterium]|jgi:1-acyl-sn-glycerol-3-phosphate acyltransferase|nr:lysophospholipid acyltransferase family protein [Thermodesulfobacteriota bacterium]
MERNPLVYITTKKVAQLVFSVFYRIETERKTTFPDHGPMIILPKHQYWTDIPIVSLAFKPLLYFVAKKELFQFPLIRDYLSLLGGLPVDREQSIRTLDSFKALVSLLKAGEKIVIFPEGTYVRNGVGSGKSRLLQMILRFQSELGYSIPFVPVGIRYGGRSGWRRRVEVRIGSPLFAEKDSDALPLTHRALEEIGRLCQLPVSTTRIAQSG